MPTSLMYPAYVTRSWNRIPEAVSWNPASGFLATSADVGSFKGGTVSQSWHPTQRRATTNAPQQVLNIVSLLEVERSEPKSVGRMAQKSTSTVKKKLRVAG